MPEINTPHKELSLDESMMLWKGQLVFQQYIKNKRHKYGVKFSEVCMDDAFVLKIQIYSGTKFTDTESLGHTGSIVLHLMEPYLNKGCHLFTIGTILYHSQNLCQKGTCILLPPYVLIESKTHHR